MTHTQITRIPLGKRGYSRADMRQATQGNAYLSLALRSATAEARKAHAEMLACAKATRAWKRDASKRASSQGMLQR